MSDLLLEYSEAHTTPEPQILARLNRETHLSQVYPQMLSGHLQGVLLRMFVRMIRPGRTLEIGAFTGYSAISMAMGMTGTPAGSPEGVADALLHTIEVNPEFEDGLRKFIHDAGLDDRIILHIGKALEIIPMLDEIWDLVFIDADKPNYLKYFNMVLPRVRSGGFIIADNVLWDGKVIQPRDKMDRDTRGIVEFNEFIHNDSRVENVILPVRDGLMIIRKK